MEHKRHLEANFGQKVADLLANAMGSWRFIIAQSIVLIFWLLVNSLLCTRWDPYPFILLNLMLSFQAAYAAPVIMMAQNRLAVKDRWTANQDYKLSKDNKQQIDELLVYLSVQHAHVRELLELGQRRDELLDQIVSSHEITLKKISEALNLKEDSDDASI